MQQMQAEGTVVARGNSIYGEEMQRSGKRGLISKPVPLFVLALFGVALSAALPYGLGLAVIVWVIALAGAIFGAGFATYSLLKELLGKNATFGYAPSAAYLAGKQMKKKQAGDTKDGQ
jgi:hypothetical protein